jgi:hypothetical protein
MIATHIAIINNVINITIKYPMYKNNAKSSTAGTIVILFIRVRERHMRPKRKTPARGNVMTNPSRKSRYSFSPVKNDKINRIEKYIEHTQPMIKAIILCHFISLLNNNISPASDNILHPLNKIHERQTNSIEKMVFLVFITLYFYYLYYSIHPSTPHVSSTG